MTQEDLTKELNKELKCPFGPCANCEKKIDPETCMILSSYRFVYAFLSSLSITSKNDKNNNQQI